MSENINLKQAVDEFVKQLEALGKKPSTVNTSRRCLDLLIAHQGEAKIVAKILPVHIATFFKAESANKNNGKPRAEASILQIRRISRQFLLWSFEQGLVARLPLPKAEAARGGGARISREQQPVLESVQENPEKQNDEQ